MKKILPVLLKPPFFLISFFIFLFSLATFSFFFSSPSNPFLDQASAQYECTWIGCGDCDAECGGGTMWCWDDCGRDWPEGCNDDPCPPAACGDGSCNEPVESCPADCPAGGETCGQIGTCADGSPVYNICSPCCSCDPQICYDTSCGVPWDCRTQGCPDPNPRCAIAGCGTVKCGDDGSCYSDCGGCEAPPPPPPPPTPIPSPPPPIPTPTPEPLNYCAIQQRNPPQTESPIIFYNLYDSYTVWETGFNEWRVVTLTWDWGGDIVLNNEDLSQMSFSRSAVDYLEGRFQDQDHRQANLLTLPSADFNQYTGRVVKLAPYLLTDQQRVNYVNAVLNTLPRLWEADFTYLDLDGQGPEKTISDLVAEYGLPSPPTASSSEAEKETWQATWGRYWQKIPLSTNDQSQGTLSAPYINQVSYPDQTGATCGFQTLTVPDNYRLTNVSASLNQILLPKEAQFMAGGSFLGANMSSSQNDPASTCPSLSYQVNASQENQAPKEDFLVANKVPEVLGESSPATNLLAAVTRPSLTEPPAAATSEITSCNLDRPDSQEGPGNKICFNNWPGTTVTKTFTETKTVWIGCEDCQVCAPSGLPDDPLTPEDESTDCWIDCVCPQTVSVTFDHQEEIGFKTRLPFLEEIWNKTTYSQERKPGFFAFFTPSIDNQVLVSRDDYSRHAATPVLLRFVDTTDDRVGTFTPQANEQLFPNYMAGVENSKNFVQNALWPTVGNQTLCLTNQPCAGNPSQTYNTFCTPSCSSPTRLCWDSGNCGPVVDCTLNGWDDYCRTLQGGGCGPYPTCNVEPVCQEGGNCVTQCSC